MKAAAKAVPKVSVSVAYAADDEEVAAARPSLLSRLFPRRVSVRDSMHEVNSLEVQGMGVACRF